MLERSIIAARLVNQGIAAPVAGTPAQAVARLGAMQAQDDGAVRWAIGLRCAGATAATVEQALATGGVVRTWLLRGTLHVVAAADVRWMLALLAPRILAGSRGRHRQLGLDDGTLAHSLGVIGAALQDDAMLTRAELLAVLEQAGIATTGQRGYYLLAHAALRGLICFGARQGKQERFMLLDARAPAAPALDPDAALGKLALRYFTGHGPATLADFAWWSGLPLGQTRTALAVAGTEIEQIGAGDRVYYHVPAAASESSTDASGVHLLPAFDEYYLGYAQRDLVLAAGLDKRVVSSNGIFHPMIVVDGRIVGTWRSVRKGQSVRIQPELFDALDSAGEVALYEAMQRFATFLGATLIA